MTESNWFGSIFKSQVLHAHVFRLQEFHGAMNRRRDIGEDGKSVPLHDVRQVKLGLGQVIIFALAHALTLEDEKTGSLKKIWIYAQKKSVVSEFEW